jgi:hypothetical protein
MCKALSSSIKMTDVELIYKHGGKSEYIMQQKQCNVCGRHGHASKHCAFAGEHPDANPDISKPWAESTQGIEWKKRGIFILPSNATLAGDTFDFKSVFAKHKLNKGIK